MQLLIYFSVVIIKTDHCAHLPYLDKCGVVIKTGYFLNRPSCNSSNPPHTLLLNNILSAQLMLLLNLTDTSPIQPVISSTELDKYPNYGLTDSQIHSLEIATTISSTLSLIASFSMMISILFWKDMKKSTSPLVLWLAVADTCCAIWMLMGR